MREKPSNKKLLTRLKIYDIIAPMEMEKKIRQAYLFDFYGELIKPSHRLVFEDYINNDLSQSEIALEKNVSRQRINNMIQDTTEKLESYESRLLLLNKFLEMKKKISHIKTQVDSVCDSLDEVNQKEILEEVSDICSEIIEEL